MSKRGLYFLAIILLLFVSCKKENVATLKIINETACGYNVYDGLNPNGNYIGKVSQFETKEFDVDMGENESLYDNFFTFEEKNCISFGYVYKQYEVTIQSGENTSIIVE
ncbi:MAG: hypothetical protein ACI8ZX_003025 [Planctomycetota bacterium]|jgi:hypothetical protein